MVTRCLFVLAAGCTQATAPSTAPAPAAPAAPSLELAADSPFAPLRALVGEWRGDDAPNHTTGSFTLGPDLGGKVLVRHSRDDGPKGHHEDLMIVSSAPAGLRAAYFDNEGHTINYAIEATAERVELVSDPVEGQPRFRLRYDVHSPDELAIDFSIAMPPGTDFHHYVGGVVHRVHR